jgi:hypothetical protein
VGYEVVTPMLVPQESGPDKKVWRTISGRFSIKSAAEEFRRLALPDYPECYIKEIHRVQKMAQ